MLLQLLDCLIYLWRILSRKFCVFFHIRKGKLIKYTLLFPNFKTLLETWVYNVYRVVQSQRFNWWVVDKLRRFSTLHIFLIIILLITSGTVWYFINIVPKILKYVFLCHYFIIWLFIILSNTHIIWCLIYLTFWFRILLHSTSSNHTEAISFLSYTRNSL